MSIETARHLAMALRERKKAALRATIVRNAVTLFQRRGYDAVSLEEIVAASMCSRSTFHRYFGTKEDLLFPTAEDRLRRLEARLRANRSTSDPWSVLRSEVSAALRGFVDDLDPDLRAKCIALWFNEPTPRRRYLEIVMEWEHAIFRFLEPHTARPKDHLLELRLLASSVTSALRAALTAAMQTGGDVSGLIERAFQVIEPGARAILSTLVRGEERRRRSSKAPRRAPGGSS